MDVKESLRVAFKELIVPELDKIKEENREIKTTLLLTNKRLDDINIHLADQSRRIDETNKRIDEINKRIDDTNKRIDDTNKRIDDTNDRIDTVREELTQKIDEINKRMDRLYEVIVRRDEHFKLEQRMAHLEHEINELKRKIAA